MEEIDVKKSEETTEVLENLDLPKNVDKSKNPVTSKNPSASKNTNVANEINLVVDLNSSNIAQGFIMSEILGSPKARNWRGNTIWKSRF